MPCGLVFVDQALGRHAVDNRNGRLERGAGSVFVGCLNRLGNLFDMGTQLRALAIVELTVSVGLTGSFFRPEVNSPR